MNEIENLYEFKKEDALDILDRTIGFVNNCDSKASVMLGIFGVMFSILFSCEGIIELKNIIKSAINDGTTWGLIYFIILAGTIGTLGFGIFKLVQVLFAKTDCDDLVQEEIETASLIFFGGICKNAIYKQYKAKLIKCSEEDYMNDVISQVYINSVICNKKFENYKKGLNTSLVGFLAFILIWGLGIIIY